MEAETPKTPGSYCITLAKSGQRVTVLPGQTILDCVMALGIEPLHSCREGICGTCETRVISGIPDHFDMVLSDAQRAANDRMMICCSGSLSPNLVLDL